jgi:hypothetical protein
VVSGDVRRHFVIQLLHLGGEFFACPVDIVSSTGLALGFKIFHILNSPSEVRKLGP